MEYKITGFGGEYFGTGNKSHEMEGYRGVIDSKSIEESLVSHIKQVGIPQLRLLSINTVYTFCCR